MYDSKDQRTNGDTYVLDTSFFIDLSARMRWTLEISNLIKSGSSELIVPSGVKNEFDDWGR